MRAPNAHPSDVERYLSCVECKRMAFSTHRLMLVVGTFVFFFFLGEMLLMQQD